MAITSTAQAQRQTEINSVWSELYDLLTSAEQASEMFHRVSEGLKTRAKSPILCESDRRELMFVAERFESLYRQLDNAPCFDRLTKVVDALDARRA